jgi:hypothetical protein
MRIRRRQFQRVCTLYRDYRARAFGKAGRGSTVVAEFAVVIYLEAERRIVRRRKHVAVGSAIGRHKANHGAANVSREHLADDKSRGHDRHQRGINDGLRRRRVGATVKLDELVRPHRADVEMAHRARCEVHRRHFLSKREEALVPLKLKGQPCGAFQVGGLVLDSYLEVLVGLDRGDRGAGNQ